ncbi:MAG: hypothetical protein EHM87_15490 [Burkholderiales bacterium]|nr:MAG: hypothetical protein EHM87_15490 [Burkholderiales bacterium]
MAPHHVTGTHGPVLRAATRLLHTTAAAACVLLAACAGGDPAGPAPAATAVAGESYSLTATKPLGNPPEASAAAVGAVPAGGLTLLGKVRYGVPSTAQPGIGQSLVGALPFPIDDAWNRDLVRAVPDVTSPALIAAIGPGATLSPGFGAFAGVPYAVVDRQQPAALVRFAGTSATRSWPIPTDLQPSADASARMVVLDRDAGVLHELRGAVRGADGSWDAVSGATWKLELADAAPIDAVGEPADDGGLPVFPGLIRYDEANAGAIRHALRVTVPAVRAAWVPPARRAAAAAPDASLPPVGLRLRLKADVAIPADASPASRAILQALKTYGMIVAGVGPGLTLEGVPDERWDSARLAADLSRLRGGDFEAISMSGLTTP